MIYWILTILFVAAGYYILAVILKKEKQREDSWGFRQRFEHLVWSVKNLHFEISSPVGANFVFDNVNNIISVVYNEITITKTGMYVVEIRTPDKHFVIDIRKEKEFLRSENDFFGFFIIKNHSQSVSDWKLVFEFNLFRVVFSRQPFFTNSIDHKEKVRFDVLGLNKNSTFTCFSDNSYVFSGNLNTEKLKSDYPCFFAKTPDGLFVKQIDGLLEIKHVNEVFVMNSRSEITNFLYIRDNKKVVEYQAKEKDIYNNYQIKNKLFCLNIKNNQINIKIASRHQAIMFYGLHMDNSDVFLGAVPLSFFHPEARAVIMSPMFGLFVLDPKSHDSDDFNIYSYFDFRVKR